MSDEQLGSMSPAGMYLLAYGGFSYGGKEIDYNKGVNELDSLAQFYSMAGFRAAGDGGQADREKFIMLYEEFAKQPPEHCPVPVGIYMISIGRLLGYPVCLVQTPKGMQICMRSPEQDCFLDIDGKEPQFWFMTEETPPPPPKPGMEQIGKKREDYQPKLHHWLFESRDILGLALAERANRIKIGNLSEFIQGKTWEEDKLVIENDNGKFEMKPEDWERQTLLQLIALLQAQSISPRADLRRMLRVPTKVSSMGFRDFIRNPFKVDDFGSGGPPDPKIPPIDRKTRPICNLVLEKLLEKRSEELGGLDIALMNLACADELPGSGKIDIATSLATLDQWAEIVRYRIESNEYLFYDNPFKFDYDKNKFKAAMLVLCLQADIGVHYNPAVAAVTDPAEMAKKYPGSKIDSQLELLELQRSNAGGSSEDQFITGILSKTRIGTCASLPVLYAAVGRRLGFPLKLVTVPGHVFVRWESERTPSTSRAPRGFRSTTTTITVTGRSASGRRTSKRKGISNP